MPKTRTKWWTDKINTNKANDEKVAKELKKEGWKIITVGECKLKPGKIEKTQNSFLKNLSEYLPVSGIVCKHDCVYLESAC